MILDYIRAFIVGISDGLSCPGGELSSGMSYDDCVTQDCYDIGTHLGSFAARRRG